MSMWDKKLTISWLFVVLLVSATAFLSGVVYDSSEDYNKAYTNGFFDGLDYQAFYLETSGRICYYANVTDITERKGYDEFGKYRFLSDIAKEDGLKVADEPGFYYKLSYREEPKQTELTNFTYYLNISEINFTCDDNLSFFSEDYNEEYESKCRSENWVTILLPQFNLTKNTTMWVHWSEGADEFRRKVVISPYGINKVGRRMVVYTEAEKGVVMTPKEIKEGYVAWRLNDNWKSVKLTGIERIVMVEDDLWCDCVVAPIPDNDWKCQCYYNTSDKLPFEFDGNAEYEEVTPKNRYYLICDGIEVHPDITVSATVGNCIEVREDEEGNIHFSSGWFRFEDDG